MNRPPSARKSPAQQSFSIALYTHVVIGALLYFGWAFGVPYVSPSVAWLTNSLSPWLSPWIDKFLHFNSPDLEVGITLAALLFILFLICIPFLPMLEGWLIRDRLRSGERQGHRVQNIRLKRKSDPKADKSAR